MTKDNAETAAREYIDKVRKINAKYGLGNASTERYESAVEAAVRSVAPLAARAHRAR